MGAIRDFLDDYVGWATAEAALRELDALEAEVERLRERAEYAEARLVDSEDEVKFWCSEVVRLREEYEDLCVDCSSSISNMEQRAEKAEREVERLRDRVVKAEQYAIDLEAEVKRLRAMVQETVDVMASMFAEDNWPPERLAPRLKRLETLSRAALTQEEE